MIIDMMCYFSCFMLGYYYRKKQDEKTFKGIVDELKKKIAKLDNEG